ncbi:hypothetical protein AB0A60_07560 [Streptomyces sp. NPDC046275]|uniref:hypothetical protein n=1 Tax=Streptomyces sp. NPDC046275 TaxID=3157201 RepID=UPI0033EBA57F
MAFQATEQIITDDPPETPEEAILKYDVALADCDTDIFNLEQLLLKKREHRIRLASGREEACAAVACKESALKTARELLAPQQDAAHPPPPAQSGRQLTIVPTDAQPSSATPPTDPPAPEGGTATDSHISPDGPDSGPTGSPLDVGSELPDEVIVRGARMKQILTVMAQRPDADWGTGDVAALLGVSESDIAARRALRENLRNLARRGVLERVTVEGDFHTYYRPRMNWRFA